MTMNNSLRREREIFLQEEEEIAGKEGQGKTNRKELFDENQRKTLFEKTSSKVSV